MNRPSPEIYARMRTSNNVIHPHVEMDGQPREKVETCFSFQDDEREGLSSI